MPLLSQPNPVVSMGSHRIYPSGRPLSFGQGGGIGYKNSLDPNQGGGIGYKNSLDPNQGGGLYLRPARRRRRRRQKGGIIPFLAPILGGLGLTKMLGGGRQRGSGRTTLNNPNNPEYRPAGNSPRRPPPPPPPPPLLVPTRRSQRIAAQEDNLPLTEVRKLMKIHKLRHNHENESGYFLHGKNVGKPRLTRLGELLRFSNELSHLALKDKGRYFRAIVQKRYRNNPQNILKLLLHLNQWMKQQGAGSQKGGINPIVGMTLAQAAIPILSQIAQPIVGGLLGGLTGQRGSGSQKFLNPSDVIRMSRIMDTRMFPGAVRQWLKSQQGSGMSVNEMFMKKLIRQKRMNHALQSAMIKRGKQKGSGMSVNEMFMRKLIRQKRMNHALQSAMIKRGKQKGGIGPLAGMMIASTAAPIISQIAQPIVGGLLGGLFGGQRGSGRRINKRSALFKTLMRRHRNKRLKQHGGIISPIVNGLFGL